MREIVIIVLVFLQALFSQDWCTSLTGQNGFPVVNYSCVESQDAGSYTYNQK